MVMESAEGTQGPSVDFRDIATLSRPLGGSAVLAAAPDGSPSPAKGSRSRLHSNRGDHPASGPSSVVVVQFPYPSGYGSRIHAMTFVREAPSKSIGPAFKIWIA